MSSELVSLYCRVLTTPFNMLTHAGAGFRQLEAPANQISSADETNDDICLSLLVHVDSMLASAASLGLYHL